MALEDLDDGLKKALEKTITNPHNVLEDSMVRVITITNEGRNVVSVYPDRREIIFHGEYTQIAPELEELKPLVTFAISEEYATNLD
jgi:hypothetical protein